MKKRFLSILAIAVVVAACESGSFPVAPEGTLLLVTANPSTISLTGTSTISVAAHDSAGIPVPSGTGIRFGTDQGEIPSMVPTGRDGMTAATLKANGRSGTANITVSTGGVSAAVVVTIEDRPSAAFSCSSSGLTVIFTDESTGDPTRREWDFGDRSSSTVKDPVHTYGGAGSYVVTLKVRGDGSEDTTNRFLELPGGTCE